MVRPLVVEDGIEGVGVEGQDLVGPRLDPPPVDHCLLYTSDAADERSSVDLGGRRIIKKKKHETIAVRSTDTNNN